MKFDFKQVLQGVKKHWAIPTLSIVTVGILGATWWFSSSWNNQIRTDQEKAANDLLSQAQQLIAPLDVRANRLQEIALEIVQRTH